MGGFFAGVLTIAFSLSFAALVFSGPLTPYLGYGIAATFASCVVIAAVLALGSSVPFAIGGIESATAAVAAIVAASAADKLLTADPGINLLVPVVLTLSSATAITGLALCLFGLSGIGRVIRYVPYPVIGGFLGAAGLLIVLGAIKVVSGQSLRLNSLGAFADPTILGQLVATFAVGAALNLTLRRTRSVWVLPVIIVVAMAIAHAWFAWNGISLAEAQTRGWTFATPPATALPTPWQMANFAAFPWHIVPSLAGDIVAVVFVTIMTTLFNTAGLEVQSEREAVLERELTATGIANLASALVGGYSGCVSFSRSMLNVSCGARSPVSGLVTAALCLSVMFIDPAFIGAIPKFLLGGLLLHLGADQISRWVFDARQRLSLAEYLSLLAIIAIIIYSGFIAGVVIGIVIGCAAFAFSASRINPIKFAFNGLEYRSSLDRSRGEIALLDAHGGEVQGLKLQSYLFFGSANRLYRHVNALLARQQCQFLLFDFSLVNGIDSSAAHSFTQIKRAASERDVTLVIVGLTKPLRALMRNSAFLDGVLVMPDLDRALERCENEVIARHHDVAAEAGDLKAWFTGMLDSAAFADELIARCQRIEVKAGEVIARAGDPADSMHFILDGRVNILISGGGKQSTRVRSLGRHTTIGEMGLVTKQPRSATIEADSASVLYILPARAFEAIKTDNPALSQRLLTYIIAVMAERLAFANRTIGVLQR